MKNKKQKIVFRADGNHRIGMGHFVRTLALSDMLSASFYTVFALQSPSLYQRNNILEVCDGIIELPEGNIHFEYFIDILQGDEIVVLDNYYFDTDYQKEIKKKGCKLVCIDDMHDKHYLADVVVNHAPGLKPELFSCEPYTKLCLGLDFLLLRRPFLEAGKNFRKVSEIKNIFICFGGSDYYNLTLKALDACLTISNLNEINIVIGSAYGNKKGLSALCSKYEHARLYENLDAGQMACLMLKSHLAVVPASGILLEAISTHLPAVTGYYAGNQENILAGFENIPNVINIGDFRAYTEKDLTTKIEEAIGSLAKKEAFCFEGKSKEKFKDLFEGLCHLSHEKRGGERVKP